MNIWLVYCLGSISTVLMLKAAWHWHSASESLTPADLAGMSDGRDVVHDLINDMLAQSASNAKGALFASVSAVFGFVALVASLYFIGSRFHPS
ncbi:hypothetical protein [Phyllobacterium sp. K27]